MPKKQQWMILDMDEGLLRCAPSKKAAVEWCKDVAGYVVEGRDCYRDGAYRYVFGYGDGSDSGFSCFIEREDVARKDWDWCVNDTPKYPYQDRPYSENEEV